VTTSNDGAFSISGSDCGGGTSIAFFHFGRPGSGEEVRIDISSGYRGPGVYGPGTFGVSSSVNHAGHGWFVNFQSSSDATLTIDNGARAGKISFTSEVGMHEAVSAEFKC